MILDFFRQCNYKCTKENSVRDGDTSPSTSNPIPTKLDKKFVNGLCCCVQDVSQSHVVRCCLCQTPFQALSSLLLHYGLAHAQQPDPECMLMCVHCTQTFKDLTLLTLHVTQDHADKVDGEVSILSSRWERVPLAKFASHHLLNDN